MRCLVTVANQDFGANGTLVPYDPNPTPVERNALWRITDESAQYVVDSANRLAFKMSDIVDAPSGSADFGAPDGLWFDWLGRLWVQANQFSNWPASQWATSADGVTLPSGRPRAGVVVDNRAYSVPEPGTPALLGLAPGMMG